MDILDGATSFRFGPRLPHGQVVVELDGTFGIGGKVTTDFGGTDFVSALVLQPDGKLVAAGGVQWLSANADFGLARYNADGSLDSTFGTGGRVTTHFGGDDAASALLLQPDGKLVAAGMADLRVGPQCEFGLARYNADGSLDATFGNGGKVITDFATGANGVDVALALALQPDGKLVAAGGSRGQYGMVLARYLPDGSLDATFGQGGKVFHYSPDVWGFSLVVQLDGKLVAATAGYTAGDFGLARYDHNGTLDTTFGTGGRVSTNFGVGGGAMAVVLQPDGKLVAAGGAPYRFAPPFPQLTGVAKDFLLARYNPDGSLDPTFGTGGKVTIDFGGVDGATALVLQPDGRLVAAGMTGNGREFAVARYYPNGGLDDTFGFGRVTTGFGSGNAFAYALVVQPDGCLVAAGSADGDFALVRYVPGFVRNLPTPRPPLPPRHPGIIP